MRARLRGAALAVLGPALLVCAQSSATRAADVGAARSQLDTLFHDSDEANLKRNPLKALARGALRYADRLGYDLSDAYFDAERAANESDLRRLRKIDRSALQSSDQIAYDAFKWEKEISLKALDPKYVALTAVLPVEHFTGFHLDYADMASGNGIAPFQTVEDYENNLKRHKQYAEFIDSVIARLRQGMASGIVQPRHIVEKVIRQLDHQIAGSGETIFMAPVKAMPPAIPQAAIHRMTEDYTRTTIDTVLPALTRLRDFLKSDYWPKARDSVGLGALKGGAALYALAIEQSTTLPLDPSEIYEFGLVEVSRIHGQMEAVKRAVGFTGTLHEFFEHIRNDPRLRITSLGEIQREFALIEQRISARLSDQFAALPKARLEVRPEPRYKEIPGTRRETGASGYYQAGSQDGTRPGVFFYVVGSTPEMDTLYLHEALPGHHLQVSVAQENPSLPKFLRFGWNAAYSEGWGLYAETLWRELGVEADPYRRFGGLNAEIVRAIRLVVDTGIHSKGWTREQAITFMLENSGVDRAEAESGVDRYIVTPGQALAYKIGERTILQLKARAQAKFGTRFDPRAFHDQILSTGALPLGILRKKVDAWLAGQ